MSVQSIPSDDVKRKKACQHCIRAKAKCSPSDNALDMCYRCQRLGKECVIEESVRRKGPKSRSRVRALEQRVESLVDMIATNNAQSSGSAFNNSTPTLPVSTGTTEPLINQSSSRDSTLPVRAHIYPERTRDEQPQASRPSTASAYEPVAAGALDYTHAKLLLGQFHDLFMPHFPFVVIDASVSVDALRHKLPFLFHAIMAVMTYTTPSIQRTLSEEFQRQIANRIVILGHKSLEILQGLLVYVAWYHYFHDLKKQQLATILQLCVAQVLDLGLPRDRNSRPERSSEEKRAYLGTYYLNSVYAHTWRKCNTLPHSRFMVQCYRSLSSNPEHSSDTVIAPIIQLSELMCRVSDYFSYNDIHDGDVKGQMMLDSATRNFCSEMERIKDAVPTEHRKHTTLNLQFDLLSICIRECALHSELWSSHSMTAVRSRMLYCAIQAVRSYLDAFLALEGVSVYHLPVPAWCGWFYSHVINCKLVFVGVDHLQVHLPPVQQPSTDRGGLVAGMPNDFYSLADNDRIGLHMGEVGKSTWHPVTVAEETQVQLYFEKFIEKLHSTLPSTAIEAEDPLFGVTCLLISMHKGFSKKLERYSARPTDTRSERDGHPGLGPPTSSASGPSQRFHPSPRFSFPWAPDTPTSVSSIGSFSTSTVTPSTHIREGPGPNTTATCTAEFTTSEDYVRSRVQKYPVPLLHTMNLNSMDFGTLEESDQAQTGAAEQLGQNSQFPESGHLGTGFDDWIWDVMMEDWSMPAM